MTHVRPRFAPRRLRRIAIFALVLSALAACGGSPEPSLDELLANGGGDDVLTDLTDLGGGGVSASVGDADFAVGTDLDRPAWLPGWVQLPDGLEIELAVNDQASGDRVLQGRIPNADATAVKAELFAMAVAQGYERLGETDFFVKAGEPALELDVVDDGSIVRYRWAHANRSEQSLRDTYAPSEGQGTLTFVVNGVTVVEEGTCTLRANSAHFASENADFTVDPSEGQALIVFGNVTMLGGEVPAVWTPGFDPELGAPTATLTGNGFTVEGPFANTFAFGEPAVPGSVTVTCS